MELPVEELAQAARSSLHPIFRKPVFVLPELLGSAGEAYLTRDVTKTKITEWTEPPAPESGVTASNIPEEIDRLLDDLDRLVTLRESEHLSRFLPNQTAGESLLRASLLPLLSQTIGGEGVAARLGAMPLRVVLESGGALVQASSPLSEVSAGTIEMQVEVTHE
jgi:hypothetical protein